MGLRSLNLPSCGDFRSRYSYDSRHSRYANRRVASDFRAVANQTAPVLRNSHGFWMPAEVCHDERLPDLRHPLPESRWAPADDGTRRHACTTTFFTRSCSFDCGQTRLSRERVQPRGGAIGTDRNVRERAPVDTLVRACRPNPEPTAASQRDDRIQERKRGVAAPRRALSPGACARHGKGRRAQFFDSTFLMDT
jgi:hypothetical protein